MTFILQQYDNGKLHFQSGRIITVNTAFVIKLSKLLTSLSDENETVKEHLEGHPDWASFTEDGF